MTRTESAEHETLRCIYCQRTIQWPMTEAYPQQCLHCGRWTCYTAARSDSPTPPATTEGGDSGD